MNENDQKPMPTSGKILLILFLAIVIGFGLLVGMCGLGR